MPPEIAEVVGLVALTVLAPGLCLVALAKFGYTKIPATRKRLKRNTVAGLGWSYILLACVFFLYVQMLVGSSNGPGGLGSLGNPLGAIAILGFAFVVGPVASIVFAAILVTFVITSPRKPRNNDG